MSATPITQIGSDDKENKEEQQRGFRLTLPDVEPPTEFTWTEKEQPKKESSPSSEGIEVDEKRERLNKLIEETGEFPVLGTIIGGGAKKIQETGGVFGYRFVQGLNDTFKDFLYQSHGILGAKERDPDDYPEDKFPSLYYDEFKLGPDGKFLTEIVDGQEQFVTERRIRNQLNPSSHLINQLLGTNLAADQTVSLFGENPLFGIQLGEPRKANADGTWSPYNFGLTDKPLDRPETDPISNFIGELGAFGLMFWLTNKALGGQGAKLNFPFTKKAQALIKLGAKQKNPFLTFKGRTIRAATEGLPSGYLSQRLLGQPGEGDLVMGAADTLIGIGDSLDIDLRGPITNYFSSENKANDPYWKARSQTDIRDLIQAFPLALGFEGIGALKTAFGPGIKSKANIQFDRTINFFTDLLAVEKADKDVVKAQELAAKGPLPASEIKEPGEIYPNKRVTGKAREGTPTEKAVTNKATQEELDIQVEDLKKVRESVIKEADASAQKLLEPVKEPIEEQFTKAIDDVDTLINEGLDTRGKGEFYHGTAEEVNLVDGGEYSSTPIYGFGFYATEDLTTAASYRKKIQGKPRKYNYSYQPENFEKDLQSWKDRQKPTVYKVIEKKPIKFFDLDQPLNEDIALKLQDAFGEHHGADLLDEALDLVEPGASIARIMDEVRSLSAREGALGMSASDILDYFQDFTLSLQKEGYGGFTHEGGYLAGKGKRLHQVRIYWDPAESIEVVKADRSTIPGLSPINETKFREAFKHLPEEEIESRLREVQRKGKLTGNPTKIGDKPPTTAVVKDRGAVSKSLRGLLSGMKEQDGRLARGVGEFVDAAGDLVRRNKEISEKIQTQGGLVPTELPVAPPNLKQTIERYKSIRYRHDRVSFESDVDLAILTIQGVSEKSTRAKAHDELVNWVVHDLGIEEDVVDAIGVNIRNQIRANKKNSANAILQLADTRVWEMAGGLELMIEGEPRDLSRILKERDKKLTEDYRKEGITKEEYEKATSPEDPGDPFDPRYNYNLHVPEGGSLGKDIADNLRKFEDEEWWQASWKAGIPVEGPQSWETIAKIASQKGGIKIRVDVDFWPVVTEKSAAGYGGKFKVGDKIDVKGAYAKRRGFVVMSMMHRGNYVTWDSALRTIWHESFHALQDRVMTKAEREILDKSRNELKALVRRGFFYLSDDFINKLDNVEMQAWAFAAWESFRPEYIEKTWAQPFEKLRSILESINNRVFKKEYTTWEDLFVAAETGALADRAPRQRGFINQAEMRKRNEILNSEDYNFQVEPEDIKNAAKKHKEAIERGEMTGNDAIKNEAMQSSTRRYRSKPPGKKDYVDRSKEDLIAMNRAFEDAINDAYSGRAELTDISSFKETDLMQKAIKQVKKSGYSAAETIRTYEQARKGNAAAQDDLVAAAGLLHHREINMEELARLANDWEYTEGVDEAEVAAALLARWKDQWMLDTAWSVHTRKSAQGLRVAQISQETATAATLDRGTEVKQTISEIDSTNAIEKGYTTQDGLLGEGVYYSTDSTPGKVDDVELYGRIPEDVYILDISKGARRITDLLEKLGLGDPQSNEKGEIVFTKAQQEGIREYVVGSGYEGIRYGTDFLKNTQGSDRVVIYDLNTANRIIDSDAAIPPERDTSSLPNRTLLAKALEETEGVFEQKLPEGIRESIIEGEITPQVREIIDGLSALVWNMKNTPGFKEPAMKLVSRVPAGRLDPNAIGNIYRNSIFFSTRTWMRASLGSAYRAATLPLTQMLGEGFTQISSYLKDDPEALRLSNRRQHLNLLLFSKYQQNLPQALRMMTASFRQNETFINVGRSQADWHVGRNLEASKQMELNLTNEQLKSEGIEYWNNPNSNPLSIVKHNLNAFAKSNIATFSGRVLGAMDTFHSAMVGPSYEWIRLMEIELFKADKKGFEPGSIEAWRWAEERTDEAFLKRLEDIDLGNGTIIKNGRLNSKYAKLAMDWVNFTDDVAVSVEPRRYEYGVKDAHEKGITDPQKILEHADWFVRQPIKDNQARQFGESIINAPGLTGQALMNMARGKDGVDNIFMNTAVALARPTNRTPVNLVKSGLRMTPGLNVMVDSYWRDIHSDDPFTRARATGEVALGGVILSIGAYLATTKLIDWSGPAPADVAERFEEDRAGKQPWSARFLMPNGEYTSWYDIEMFDQLATVMGTIAAYNDNVATMSEEEGETFAGWATVALAGTAKEVGLGVFTKRALGGLTDLFDLVTELQNDDVKVISGSRWEIETYVTNKLAGFWPAFSNIARNAVDPVRRQIDASTLPPGLNMIENGLKTLALRTPGLSWTQPPRLHPITGRPIPSNSVAGSDMIPESMPWLKAFYDVITPLNVSKSKLQSTDPVDLELLRIQGKGGTFQIWSRRAFNLNNRVLNTSELNELIRIGTSMKIHGRTLHQALLDKIQDSKYQSLPEYDHTDSSMSTRGIALMEVINLYKNGLKNNEGVTIIKGAKDLFEEKMDTGPGSLGFEIKATREDNRQKRLNAIHGVEHAPTTLDALRKL